MSVPIVEATTIDVLENAENPISVPAIISKATPNPEPELIPKTKGPAKEFLNKDCIKTPEIDNAIPTINAVIALGNRKLYKMKFSVLSDKENSSLNITLGSIHSDPINKSKIKSSTATIKKTT